jgi:hypothetical protein
MAEAGLSGHGDVTERRRCDARRKSGKRDNRQRGAAIARAAWMRKISF